MTNKVLKYGLRHKSKNVILKIHEEDNESSRFSGNYSYTLGNYDNQPDWLVNKPETAEYIRNYGTTPWYSTNNECPSHVYNADELEVVSVEIETSIVPIAVTIPSYEEFLAKRIADHKGNPNDVSMFEKRLKEYLADKDILSLKELNKKYNVTPYDLLRKAD